VGVVVELNVGVVMAGGKAHGETGFVVSEASIPSIRGLAREGRVINSPAVEGGRECDAGLRVAVVRGYTESAKQSGEERKTLFPGDFDALNMSAGPVDRLQQSESSVRLPRGNRARCRVNRIGQLLVKVPSLEDTKRLKKCSIKMS